MNQERLLVNPLLASLGVLAAVKTLNSVARRRLFEHVVVVVGNPTTLTEMPSTWEWIGVSQFMKSGFIFTHSWIKNPSICFQVQIRRVFFVVFLLFILFLRFFFNPSSWIFPSSTHLFETTFRTFFVVVLLLYFWLCFSELKTTWLVIQREDKTQWEMFCEMAKKPNIEIQNKL